MTTTSKQKRLDTVDAALTPKEWAIRLVDEMRRYPSEIDFGRTIAKGKPEDSPAIKPFVALNKQGENSFPGWEKKQDVYRAMIKRIKSLRTEFDALRKLAFDTNRIIRETGEIAALTAALKLSKLETAILQDAFGRTARKAAEWVEEYKPADTDEEENRQVMLKELAAYTDFNLGEHWTDSMPIMPGIRIRFPSAIENLVADVVALAAKVFNLRAAVQVIQDKFFDGHPFLYLDVEAGLADTIKKLEGGIAVFNDYLKTRAELFKNDWEVEEESSEEGIASAIPGEREGRLFIDLDAIRATPKRDVALIADQWIKLAKDTATACALKESGEDHYYMWEKLREELGVNQ